MAVPSPQSPDAHGVPGKRRARESRNARGYGPEHFKIRARYKKLVDQFGFVCWRCGQQFPPRTPFDLGHDDQDRTVYRGPECLDCNRSTSTRRAAKKRRPEENHPGSL